MILKSLTIQNIRSYTQAHIDFPSGSILLAGDIGSGKSTLLQAIEFALFGIMRGDLEAVALLRSGTNKGSVTLSFSLGEKQISITRNLIRGKQAITQDTGTLTINGFEEKLTATELRKRIIDLLAYPLAIANKSPSLIYRYTVYTSQEQMKEILAQTPQERLQTLRAVFGIDTYQRMKENVTVLLRALKEKSAFLEGQVQNEQTLVQQLTNAQDDFAQLQKTKADAAKKCEQAKKQLAAIEEQHILLQKTIVALTTLQAQANAIEQEIKELSAQETTQKNRIEALKTQQFTLAKELADAGTIAIDLTAEQQLIDEKKQYDTKAKKNQFAMQQTIARLAAIDEKVNTILESNKKREQLQAQFEQLSAQEETYKSQLSAQEKAQTDLAAINEQIMKTSAAHGATTIEKERLTVQINHTHENGICELCLQEVTPQQQQLSQEQKKQQLTQIMHVLTTAESDLRQLQKDKEQLTKTIATYQQNATMLANIQGKKQTLSQQLESTQASADLLLEHKALIEKEQLNLRDEAVQIGTQLTAIDMQLEIVRAQKEKSLRLMQYEQRIADLQVQIVQQTNDLHAITTKAANKKDELGRMQAQLTTFTSLKDQERHVQQQKLQLREVEISTSQTLAQVQALSQSAQQAIEQIKSQLTQISAIKTQFVALQQQKQWLSTYFTQLMDIIEQHVFMTVHADFVSHFQKWLHMLLDDQALHVTLDATLSPQITQNGYDVSVTQLSGGEKTSVALAYRLALNRVISDVFATIKTKNLLILDEPTDGFSEEQLDRVRDVLSAIPSGQLVIVSHEPKVETFVDHVLRVQKTNHLSVISQS